MWFLGVTELRLALHRLAPVLLVLWLAGAAFVPGAAAQGSGSDLTGTIVFQTVSGGPIYAIDAGGSNLRQLTTGIDPALSPQGDRVAFTRWDDSQHGASGSLWVINLDGSDERPILGEIHQPKAPVWSPDGTRIVINVQQGGRLQPEHRCSQQLPSEPLLADEDGDYFRAVVEVDDGEVEVKYCYTLLPHPFWGLRMVDVATGAFEDLPHDRFSYTPTWDPANPWHLVYDGEMGLVNLDLDQGTTWALTDDAGDHGPVFSPDGSRIAVSYWQHDHWEVHVIDADGSGRVRLTETPLPVLVEQRLNGHEQQSWNNVAPTWSPDGAQIAFLTDRTGQWEMWVMPAPGAQAPWPAWRPVVARASGPGSQDGQVPADGGDQRPLFPAGTLDGLTLGYSSVDERALSWR